MIKERMSNTVADKFQTVCKGGKNALAKTLGLASKGMNKLAKSEFVAGVVAVIGGMGLAVYGGASGNANLVEIGAMGEAGLAIGVVAGAVSKMAEFGLMNAADKLRDY